MASSRAATAAWGAGQRVRQCRRASCAIRASRARGGEEARAGAVTWTAAARDEAEDDDDDEEARGRAREAPTFTTASDFVRHVSWLARTGRDARAERVVKDSFATFARDSWAASTSVSVVLRAGDVESAREMMRAHRAARVGNQVSIVTLCAWAKAEELGRRADGDAAARALLREATRAADEDDSDDLRLAVAGCEAWIASGKFELAHGRLDKAQKCFKHALERYRMRAPASASIAAHAWADIEARRKDANKARELFALAVEICPTHIANYTSWAAFELSRGKSEEARALFRRGADVMQSSSDSNQPRAQDRESRRQRLMDSALLSAWAALEGQLVLQAARSDEDGDASPEHARALFARACQCEPKNIAGWLQWSALEEDLARGNSHQGGVVIARRRVSNRRQLDVLHAGLKANPGEMRLEHARAMALKLNGDVDGATKALWRLSERFPKSSHVWHALGTILQESGDFQGAIQAFERGANASGKANLACVTAAAAAEFHGGQHGRARQLFVQGESIPRYLSTRRERAAHLRLWALLEKRVGSEEAARRLFIAATNEDRTDAATWLQWGQWEKRVNSISAARKVFSDGVKFGVHNGQYFVYQALATLEAEAGRSDAARELFKQGCSAHPRSASLWLQWSLFEFSQQDKEHVTRAIKVIESGVARAPPHMPLLELWLDLERERGNVDAAKAVEARLTRLLSEQRYHGPVGREVRAPQ